MERADRPVIAEEMVSEIWKIHQKVPLYPGIVAMCLNKMIEEVAASTLKKGDRVGLLTSQGKFYGTVEKISEDEVLLKDVSEIKKTNFLKVEKNQILLATKLEEDILSKLWPSLICKEPL